MTDSTMPTKIKSNKQYVIRFANNDNNNKKIPPTMKIKWFLMNLICFTIKTMMETLSHAYLGIVFQHGEHHDR